MEKNATLGFTFYPEDYPDVDMTFHCDENLDFPTLLDYFRRFAIAMSFSPQTIDKYIGEEE